ncbi:MULTISPECIES: riboflavin synthase [Candidatus Hamiltonella]|uniref:Riboflavin synthase n=1 Tax=Hamiltonella defensa subsp. Acyrthosiphon pisum (strain 5AT) TaxID=572265 RepID=C4K471_HAMD5|nr:riboflavin synthase [Candidatus Hamiltonella defensa]ACQ67364.1 riboflavin synthase, alpha subunit [Candidatus Hamiltonella defensa 5AT (Acyrthosiphon pisum)]ATW22102.1 riboflavin synthase subunit alpha [Candidatus Hamiltonella defensa]
MFTGIIQDKATVVDIQEGQNFRTITLTYSEKLLYQLKPGASVAHDGCCLTVTKIDGDQVSFDLMQETLRVTTLNQLKIGSNVNVEKAARLGDEIGGHLMSGHIICTACIDEICVAENNRQIWFRITDPEIMKYIFYKGFIGVDGISLTVGEMQKNRFCNYLIPETLARTTLGLKKSGDRVNIEIDPQTQAVVDTLTKTLEKIAVDTRSIGTGMHVSENVIFV